ncbi:MAG: bifunctional nuclease family protein [Actinobacteria bacterium]|nr:bifunctional nuclease family protein [Actinomycetota bacterium]
MRQMDVVGVRLELPQTQPVVILREREGGRYLPIWIGEPEASAIALAYEGVVPARPLTHDLLRDVLVALEAMVVEVQITELRDGVFFADIVLDRGSRISARPSDGIALALRTGSPILVADSVLDSAAVEVAEDEQDEVERFREFLDQISPEDFGPETPRESR